MIRRSPIQKRTTVRAWKCSICNFRNDGGVRTCPECKTRRGSKRTSVKARCDRKASAIVKGRAGGKCENCGKEARLDWAHGWARRHHSLRWNTDAAFGLCRPCHQHFTTHPLAWSAWLIKRLGEATATRYEHIANSAWDRDYQLVLEELKAKEKP